MNLKIILSIAILLLIGIVFVSAWAAETYVSVEKGWNLLYGFMTPDQLDGQLLEKANIKAVYAFIPTTQKYAQLYPNREINSFSTIDDDEVSQMGMFVYSDKAERTEYWLDNMPAQLNEINLYSGWNFVGITQNFAGKSINQIKGNCNIQKAYAFEEGNWVSLENNMDDTRMLGENLVQFHGIVLKVSANCKLGTPTGEVPSVPNLP